MQSRLRSQGKSGYQSSGAISEGQQWRDFGNASRKQPGSKLEWLSGVWHWYGIQQPACIERFGHHAGL